MRAATKASRQDTDPMRVAVIGGGIAGLTAAHELLKSGAQVTLFEREHQLGGLASSFLIEDCALERYYHFLCLNDVEYFRTLDELGLKGRLHWKLTRMGQFYDGKLYSLGAPWDLLTFKPLGLRDKLRFGFGVMATKREPSHSWRDIEDQTVEEWMLKRFGRTTYETLHRPLIELKFGPYASEISAAWMWARINRLGKSRTRFLQLEKLGYLEGGTQTLIDALVAHIKSLGGTIRTGAPIDEILVEKGHVCGIVAQKNILKVDSVLSTIPTPYLPALVKGRYAERLAGLRRIQSIGVTCLLLRLKASLTPYFWTNLSDTRVKIAGVIEYTRLYGRRLPNGDSVVYIPQYLPSDSPRYALDDQKIFAEYVGYLKLLRPDFSPDWVRNWWVYRDRYAQPICPAGFSAEMAGMVSPIEGLFLTDSHQLFPDDRTVSNSIGLGRKAARLMQRKQPGWKISSRSALTE